MDVELGIAGQRFIIVFFRVTSILWLLPLFSLRSISIPYKVGLSLIVSFLFYELVDINPGRLGDPYFTLLLVVKEVFIGLTIGFFVRTLFAVIYVAGEMAALQTGFAFARFMDPFTMSQSSVLEQIKNLLAILIFFAIDAHHILIKGMFYSFKEVPVGGLVLNTSLLQYIIELSGRMFSLGLKIGAPLIVTLFIVEIALGILSRMIPQINIFVEGMPAKILVTLIVLSFSLGIIAPNIANIFKSIDREMLKIMRLMV